MRFIKAQKPLSASIQRCCSLSFRKATVPARAAVSPEVENAISSDINTWSKEICRLQSARVVVQTTQDESTRTEVLGCVASDDIATGQEICEIPQSAAVTAVDAKNHPLVTDVASGRSEIAALALWLMAERIAPSNDFGPFVDALPQSTMSPITWEDDFRAAQLQGSPVLPLARSREAAIRAEWASIAATLQESGSAAALQDARFTEQAFLQSFCVVLAHAIYLPAAQCFALLPFASFMQRSGNDDGCTVDYDLEREVVVVRTTRAYRSGDAVMLDDPRPNSERILATGTLQMENQADFLEYNTTLVQTDRLYTAKREVLAAMNMQDTETFPLYKERFPIQLLSFLRFARIQDVGELAKVTFERDAIISPLNEYEVLQLVMADLRESLQAYRDPQEEDVKLLQEPKLPPLERLAALLRRSEKDILLSTTDAIRNRLAPIRGIPTKSGNLEDPNKDILEVFEAVEGIGSAPTRLWKSFSRWASGKDDPDWKR